MVKIMTHWIAIVDSPDTKLQLQMIIWCYKIIDKWEFAHVRKHSAVFMKIQFIYEVNCH